MMRLQILLLALFTFFPLLFTACATGSSPLDAAPRSIPTSVVIISATPLAEETAAAVPTPDDVDAFLGQFTHALSASDSKELGSFLLNAVWLGSGADPSTGEPYSQDSGIGLLQGHWRSGLRVARVNYVRDSALLEISTTGWSPVAPFESGNLEFHLHRYNSDGQEDDLAGHWRIDTILY